MKILGERSLSSKVEFALKVLFFIIVILDIIVFIFFNNIPVSNYKNIIIQENYILIVFTNILFFLTGIVALFIIDKFIKIFKNLKYNKLFEQENIKYLNNISILSITIGTLYLIVFIATNIILEKYIFLELLNTCLIKILIFVFAIAFLIFGIGIKILNEIYKKAVEYKEENDLTI